MVQWLIERLRGRGADEHKAFTRVGEAACARYRELTAEHDAFVPYVEAVRDGIMLGTAQASDGRDIPVRLALGDEYAMWSCQGGTGSGKTSWVSSILFQEISHGRPCGVMDLKGDLFASMVRWIAALSSRLAPQSRDAFSKRIVILNPFSGHLVPLNVCRLLPGISAETQAYEVTLALSRLFENSLGIHMENLLRHLLLLLMESRLTLVEAPLVLQDEVLRGVLASQSTNPAVKQFFLGTYESLPQASKDALLNRLQALLLAENLRLMLGADDLIDFKTICESGDYLFIFLGKGPGIPEEQVEILGSLIFQLLLQATYARGTGARTRYLLAMDEFFHLLAAPGLARRFDSALTTARSFGLSLLLVSHNFAQLPATLREIVLGNCDLVALFRTSGRNASFFGDFLPAVDLELLARAYSQGRRNTISPHEIRRHQLELLQRLPSRTCFWYDRRKPHRAIRLRVPDLPAPYEFAGVSESTLERIIHEEGWDRGAVALPKQVLKAQVEARARRLYDLLHPPIEVTQNAGAGTTGAPRRARSRPSLG